jgi:mercuric ion transport protein
MPLVELIYDPDCPNVDATRGRLRTGLARLGLPPVWREWDRSSGDCPPHARRYGSPTVLVEGRDVAEGGPGDESGCCRVYSAVPGRDRGVPPLERIVEALSKPGPATSPRAAKT